MEANPVQNPQPIPSQLPISQPVQDQAPPQPSQPPTNPTDGEKGGFPKILLFFIAFGIILCVVGPILVLLIVHFDPLHKLNKTPYISVAPISTPTTSKTTNKSVFSQLLMKNCKNDKIDNKLLPFILTDEIKTKYGEKDTIYCSDVGNFAVLSRGIPNRQFENDIVYFYDDGSEWMGLGNNYFEPLNNFVTATINNNNFYINIIDPEPSGITTQTGVWTEIIAKKQDPKTGTKVISKKLRVIKDQAFLDLIKKYGRINRDGTYYELNPWSEWIKISTQFTKEVAKLIPQQEDAIQAATETLTDMSDIKF